MTNIKLIMTSSYSHTSPLYVLLLMTSSFACNVRVERDERHVNNTAAALRTSDIGELVVTPKDRYSGEHYSPSTNDTSTASSHPDLHQLFLPLDDFHDDDDGNLDNETFADDLDSEEQFVAASRRQRDVTALDHFDLSALFASSSPGDLLDDAEIEELINAEGGDEVTRKLDSNITRNGLVSRRMYQKFSEAIVYVAFPLIIVGFITNVIAIKVFRRLPRNVTNTYMMYLIYFDMAYLLFVVSSHIIVIISRAAWAQSSVSFFLKMYVAYKFFILSGRQIIITTTAFMSLDRYFVIASPFRTHNIVIFRRPRLLTLLAGLLILAFNSHKLLKRKVKSRQFPGTNNTVSYLGYSQIYQDNHGILDDLTITSSCLFQYLPLLAMLAANIALMAMLHTYSRRVSVADLAQKQDMGSLQNGGSRLGSCSSRQASQDTVYSTGSRRSTLSNRSQQELTGKTAKVDKQFFQLEKHKCVTVIVYSFLFFILALPLALLPILKKAFPEFNVFKSQHYVFLIYVRIFPLLDIISASINFFVFFIKGGAFRTGVRKIVRYKKRGMKRATFQLRKISVESDGAASTQDAIDTETKLALSVVLKGSIKFRQK